MKHIIFSFSLCLVSSLSFADIGEIHQKNCDTPEVKNLMGDKGSCRVVIAEKKVDKKGVCGGELAKDIPCYVTYVSASGSGAMNITCGKDLSAPIINEDMEADIVSYNVATLIKNSKDQDIIQNDEKEYTLASSPAVTLFTIEAVSNGTLIKVGSVTISLQSGDVSLKNVVCQ